MPQASFRFHLTMDTLALLAMCFPLTGALRTFTFKNNVRAGRTEKKGKLELSLEPERLGKLTIRLEYEKGKTEVTIFSTSAKTLEILSKEAGHLAQILEEKTGTPTVIYTPEQTENRQNMDQDPGHGRNGRQDQKEQRQKQDDSFAQQLRLGLT